MLKIVKDAGYRGWMGIEYEGSKLPEADGIIATKTLLEKIREELKKASIAAASRSGAAGRGLQTPARPGK